MYRDFGTVLVAVALGIVMVAIPLGVANAFCTFKKNQRQTTDI
ncbi:MAG: hypothetical protein Ct9H300mP2_3950 [Candidatus Neomarinimicrobiota bacterium]|nr:MAG: hypothetical protein Ct9H300mP2_3950 [Candidatus Neomarinimicrobiota bacterium]